MQLGLDVIDPINPKSRQGHAYIMTAIDFALNEKKQELLKMQELMSWSPLLKKICVREKFMTNNDTIFIGSKSTSFCGKYGIMGQSSSYYPQGNELAYSTNKTLV